MIRGIAGVMVLACGAAMAQSTDLSFEVASIKPAAPQEMGRIRIGRNGGPGTPDPGQVTYSNANVKMLLQDAYDAKGYQISGPGWIDSERFDISAKIAPGTTQEQFRLMLQNLLKERFKIALHKETKEVPVYALVPGKNGAKLKESVEEPVATDAAAGGGPSAGATPAGSGGAAGVALNGPVKLGKDGFPQLPKGGRGMMMMMMNGRFRMTGNQVTMGRLCDQLASFVDRPVLDQTGLTGKYDVTLDFAPTPGTGPMAKMGAGMMMMHKEGDAGGAPPPADQEAGPTVFTAVQEQLGLRMDPRKGPVDMYVVDKGEKVPTEN